MSGVLIGVVVVTRSGIFQNIDVVGVLAVVFGVLVVIVVLGVVFDVVEAVVVVRVVLIVVDVVELGVISGESQNMEPFGVLSVVTSENYINIFVCTGIDI